MRQFIAWLLFLSLAATPLWADGDDKKGDDKGGDADAKQTKYIEGRFGKADKKGDGKLTFDEWPWQKEGEKEEFAKADADNDGTVDKTEFVAHWKEYSARQKANQAKAVVALFDKNKDGKIGADEWPGSKDDWKALDKDADGFVETEELAASDLLRGLSMFATADKDADGSIDKDEWKGKPDGFEKADADKDGKVTLDEWSAYGKVLQAERKNHKGGDDDDDEKGGKGDKDKGDKDGDGK